MLSPYFLEHFADAYLPLAAQLDEIITRDIARRIMKAGVLTSTAKHQIDMAQQCGLLYEDIIKDVAAYTKQSEPLIRKMFDDAGAIAVSYDTVIYAAAGLIAKPLSQSRKAQNVLQAGIRKTNGLIQNLTKTTASEAQRIFINAATIAEMQVESGAFDTSSALRNAIKAAASDGGYIRYPSGHRDRLDVAMRRAMQTGINQTSAAMSIAYAEDMACDLVEVSAHIGARESHAKWQGKIYSLTGATRGYQKLSDATGYGTGDGLCGWNCRHSFYPYFETLSQEAYPKEMLEDMKSATVAFNGKELPYYDATQMQRAMERAIRDTKRQYCAYDEAAKAGKSADALRSEADKAAILLKKQRDKYTDFVTQVGFKPDIARTLTQEFGHSQASKAAWVNRKSEASNQAVSALLFASGTSSHDKLSIQKELSVIPNAHKVLAEKQIANIRVIRGSFDCGYNPTTKEILLGELRDDGAVIHEYAHALERELKLYKDAQFTKIRKSDLTLEDLSQVVYDKSTYSKEIFILKSPKFVSEYQGRIYTRSDTGIYAKDGKSIDDTLLLEYFSEGYKAYFNNSAILQKHDAALFDFIRRLCND